MFFALEQIKWQLIQLLYKGQALVKRFDGEFPDRYINEVLEYLGIAMEKFTELCDEFRSPHPSGQIKMANGGFVIQSTTMELMTSDVRNDHKVCRQQEKKNFDT